MHVHISRSYTLSYMSHYTYMYIRLFWFVVLVAVKCFRSEGSPSRDILLHLSYNIMSLL